MEKKDSNYSTISILERLNDFDKMEHDFRHKLFVDLYSNDVTDMDLLHMSKIVRVYISDFLQTCWDNGINAPECYYLAEDVLSYILNDYKNLKRSANVQERFINQKREEKNILMRIITSKKYHKDIKEMLIALALRYNDLALSIKKYDLDNHAIDILNHAIKERESLDAQKIVGYHKAYYSKLGKQEIIDEIKQRY